MISLFLIFKLKIKLIVLIGWYKITTPDVSEDLLRILEIVHKRIEEKFKNYRDAFRKMNLDFNEYLSFSEFCKGLDSIGISLKITAFRKLFDFIDSDKNGRISFQEFCKISSTIEKAPPLAPHRLK